MTKQDVINVALSSPDGGYVNTDGEWCMCWGPEELAAYIASLGFTVTRAYSTARASAIVETLEGVRAAYNGHCRMMEGA